MPAPSAPTSPTHLLVQAAERLCQRARAAAVAMYRGWHAWYAAAGSTGARFTRGTAGAAVAVVVACSPALVGWAVVRVLAAGSARVVGVVLRAVRWASRQSLARDLRDLAATVGRPAGAWLHQHAAGLPASPALLAWSWFLLAAALYLSAHCGNLAARFAWAAVGAATGAAVWQAAPEGSRIAAAAVTVGAWLLAVPSAYRETERPPRRQEVNVEAVLAALVVQQFVTVPPPPASSSSTTPEGQVQPGASVPGQPGVLPPAPVLPAAPGFCCRYCGDHLVWSSGSEQAARTWRTRTGGTRCPQAPASDDQVRAGRAHVAL